MAGTGEIKYPELTKTRTADLQVDTGVSSATGSKPWSKITWSSRLGVDAAGQPRAYRKRKLLYIWFGKASCILQNRKTELSMQNFKKITQFSLCTSILLTEDDSLTSTHFAKLKVRQYLLWRQLLSVVKNKKMMGRVTGTYGEGTVE